MKKKVIIIVILILCIIRFVPTGLKVNKETLHKIETPRFSFLKEECCMSVATFKSLKSYITLKLEIENMLNRYEKTKCGNKTYYYDKKHNITIYDYGVELKFPLNEYYIGYTTGIYPDKEMCEELDKNDTKEINFNYINGIDKDKMIKRYKYKNIDDKEYDVYEDCYDCLEIKTGNRGNSIREMLDSELVTMDDIFKQLEIEASNNHISKESFWDGGTTLYKGSNYAILRCNTIDGNKDVYISDRDLEYETNYCK